jgi:signal transduction histidine kinase
LVGFTLYRVTQEALTNVRKHAGPRATAEVRLRYLDSGVELEVTDTGQGTGLRSAGTGHGHVGMRERVAAVGGRLEVGPRARGGYLVRASIVQVAS